MTDTNPGQTAAEGATVPSRFCFVCGARMKETWHSAEQGGCYVWYECSRVGCTQTYLIRESARNGSFFSELDCRAI